MQREGAGTSRSAAARRPTEDVGARKCFESAGGPGGGSRAKSGRPAPVRVRVHTARHGHRDAGTTAGCEGRNGCRTHDPRPMPAHHRSSACLRPAPTGRADHSEVHEGAGRHTASPHRSPSGARVPSPSQRYSVTAGHGRVAVPASQFGTGGSGLRTTAASMIRAGGSGHSHARGRTSEGTKDDASAGTDPRRSSGPAFVRANGGACGGVRGHRGRGLRAHERTAHAAAGIDG